MSITTAFHTGMARIEARPHHSLRYRLCWRRRNRISRLAGRYSI